jgi:hypothetical protein
MSAARTPSPSKRAEGPVKVSIAQPDIRFTGDLKMTNLLGNVSAAAPLFGETTALRAEGYYARAARRSYWRRPTLRWLEGRVSAMAPSTFQKTGWTCPARSRPRSTGCRRRKRTGLRAILAERRPDPPDRGVQPRGKRLCRPARSAAPADRHRAQTRRIAQGQIRRAERRLGDAGRRARQGDGERRLGLVRHERVARSHRPVRPGQRRWLGRHA